MIEAVVLAFGLAMDATAVAAARGLVSRPREGVVMPLVFGVAHVVAITLGWLVGRVAGEYITAWDHWVAFALLVGIGLKMMLAKPEAAGDDVREGPWFFVVLAVATSIDAIAAGFTLPLLAAPPWIAIVLIGVIVTACTLAAYYAGGRLGARLGTRLSRVGGLVLVAIGVRILVEHL